LRRAATCGGVNKSACFSVSMTADDMASIEG
jgi:hypothetical protein